MSYKIMRFTASWCGPCKILAKNLDQTELELPIKVVDIEEEQQITQQYRVRAVPTMIIVDENGDDNQWLVLTTSWMNLPHQQKCLHILRCHLPHVTICT